MKSIRLMLLEQLSEELPKCKLNMSFNQVPLNIPSKVLELYLFDTVFKDNLNKLFELIENKDNLEDRLKEVNQRINKPKLLHSHIQVELDNNRFISTELYRMYIDELYNKHTDIKVYIIDTNTAIETDLRMSYKKPMLHRFLNLENDIVIAKEEFRKTILRDKVLNNVTFVESDVIGVDKLFESLKRELGEEELSWLE